MLPEISVGVIAVGDLIDGFRLFDLLHPPAYLLRDVVVLEYPFECQYRHILVRRVDDDILQSCQLLHDGTCLLVVDDTVQFHIVRLPHEQAMLVYQLFVCQVVPDPADMKCLAKQVCQQTQEDEQTAGGYEPCLGRYPYDGCHDTEQHQVELHDAELHGAWSEADGTADIIVPADCHRYYVLNYVPIPLPCPTDWPGVCC